MPVKREELNFPERVQSEFGFLLQRGFRFVVVDGSTVRYSSEKVSIEIYYEPRDGDVAVRFGRLGRDEEIDFRIFLLLVNPTLGKQIGGMVIERPAEVPGALKTLALAMRSEGDPILNCDEALYDRVKDLTWYDLHPGFGQGG